MGWEIVYLGSLILFAHLQVAHTKSARRRQINCNEGHRWGGGELVPAQHNGHVELKISKCFSCCWYPRFQREK